MKPREIDRPPEIDAGDVAQAVLLKHWMASRAARDFHRSRGRDGLIEATFAGHEMQWLKGIIRDVQSAPSLTTVFTNRRSI